MSRKRSPTIAAIRAALETKDKPFAIVLAGHNGSGKSTLWYKHVAEELRIPLVNADRLMLSILPEFDSTGQLAPWALELRDNNEAWMKVAQQGVQAFVAAAMGNRVPFAVETVFSHWVVNADGTIDSKLNLIHDLQRAGYFVLLMFVGLTSVNLSIGRVETRKAEGGHAVPHAKLLKRYPLTQKAINAALSVADAAILFDNSRSPSLAFTPVHIRKKKNVVFDIRLAMKRPSKQITTWLDVVAPFAKSDKSAA